MTKKPKKRKKSKKFSYKKQGDRIEIIALDHTTDDPGWKSGDELMRSTPLKLHVRGWYIGQDENTVKVAFIKCAGDYGTVFNILKGTILEVR